MLILLRRLALLGTARKYAKQHASTIHSGVDKAADIAKKRVNARHHSKVDQGSSLLKRAATGTTAR